MATRRPTCRVGAARSLERRRSPPYSMGVVRLAMPKVSSYPGVSSAHALGHATRASNGRRIRGHSVATRVSRPARGPQSAARSASVSATRIAPARIARLATGVSWSAVSRLANGWQPGLCARTSRARRERAQRAGHADGGYSKPSLKMSSPSTFTPSIFPCNSPPAASFSMPSKTSSEFTGRS